MTVEKAIEIFDSERKNSVPLAQKLQWLSQVEYKISKEILEIRGGKPFEGYSDNTDVETVLLCPPEYCEIYGLYLNMKLDYMNGEIQRYNNSAALFNLIFKELADYVNRNQKVSHSSEIKVGGLYV